MITLYGICNCDTVKKARNWLTDHDVRHVFHDYKKVGVDPVALGRWIDALGWELLLNRAGTTFRRLAEAERQDLDRERATAIMLAHPSTIKRPVLEGDGRLEVGFKPDGYAALFIG